MQSESHTELFKTLAGRIVGNWYDHQNRYSFTFSLCEGETDSAVVQMIEGKQIFEGFYKLHIAMNDSVRIVVAGLPDAFEALIKIITDDTLILQRQNGNLNILQRKADIDFANEVIKAL